MTIYEVTGKTAYRSHQPGDTFEADLEGPVEARAIRRGNITIVEKSKPKLRPGSYTLPVKHGR